MNAQDALFYMFALVSTLYVTHIGFYLIGANAYDIWQYRRQYRLRRAGMIATSSVQSPAALASKRLRSRGRSKKDHEDSPLVTVAIPAHNEEKVIVRCLESIRLCDYRNTEVLVADDASSDHTWQLVRDYMLRHPEMNLHVYRIRKNCGKARALNTILKRYATGELVMMVDADSAISPTAINNALSYFDNPSIAGVAANVQIIHEPTVLGVLQKLEHMVGYRSKKLYTMLNGEFVVGGVASTYRMDTLKQVGFYDSDTVTEDIGLSIKIVALGNRANRIVYGADVVAMTEGVPTLKALIRQRYRWKYGSMQNIVKYRRLIGSLDRRYTLWLTLYRMPMAIISELVLLTWPLAWSYAFYMTLRQYNIELMLGAYVTITTYMLIVIWFDENIRPGMRLRLSLYAPAAHFLFYIMELVQFIAVVRCLGRFPSLVKQEDLGSAWTSPQRIGRKLAATNEG